MFKLNLNGGVIRKSDNAFIPADPANADYAAFLKWQADGGVPDQADALPLSAINAPVLTDIEALENKTLRAIREYILGDTTAKDRLKVVDNEIAALRAALKK